MLLGLWSIGRESSEAMQLAGESMTFELVDPFDALRCRGV